MSRDGRTIWSLGCLALAMLAVLPSDVRAAWLGFKNDTKGVIIIQTATPVPGAPARRNKPMPLGPGEVAWEPIPTVGPRLLEITDKATGRLIGKDNLVTNGTDLYYSVQWVPQPPLKGQAQPPVLRLILSRPPVAPPAAPARPAAPAAPAPAPPQTIPSSPLGPTTPAPPRY